MALLREITTLRDALAPRGDDDQPTADTHPPAHAPSKDAPSTSTPTSDTHGDLQRAVLQQRLGALLQRQRDMEVHDPTLKVLKAAQRRKRRGAAAGGGGGEEGRRGQRAGAGGMGNKRHRSSDGGHEGGSVHRRGGGGSGGGGRRGKYEEDAEDDMFADAAATRGAALLETERDNLIRMVCVGVGGEVLCVCVCLYLFNNKGVLLIINKAQ